MNFKIILNLKKPTHYAKLSLLSFANIFKQPFDLLKQFGTLRIENILI